MLDEIVRPFINAAVEGAAVESGCSHSWRTGAFRFGGDCLYMPRNGGCRGRSPGALPPRGPAKRHRRSRANAPPADPASALQRGDDVRHDPVQAQRNERGALLVGERAISQRADDP